MTKPTQYAAIPNMRDDDEVGIDGSTYTGAQLRAALTTPHPAAAADLPEAQTVLRAYAEGEAWPQTRSALALVMLGWSGRPDAERTQHSANSVLDAVTEPGMPLAILRSAPDWRAAMAPQAGATADPRLLNFYGVTSAAELIAAQAAHIERLQAKLPQAPSFAPQRVREG